MVRIAEEKDLGMIEEIYAGAREYMRANGNPDQWGDDYPLRQMLLDDIASSSLFVTIRGDAISGVFYFAVTDDQTYRHIDGRWSYDRPYGVIHRIAAAKGEHGILSEALAFAFSRIPYLRIDTHKNNLTMRRALESRGFSECGIIRTYDGSERIAYDVVSV